MSWSTGNAFSPYIGGIFIGISSGLPIIVSCCIAGLCFIAVSLSKNQRGDACSTVNNISVPALELNENLPKFKWMARMALISSFICVGLVRSQLGLLFKFELGYSESLYGIAVTAMTVGNFLFFVRSADGMGGIMACGSFGVHRYF